MRMGPQDGIGPITTKEEDTRTQTLKEHVRMGKWPSANQEEEPTRTQRGQLWDLGSQNPRTLSNKVCVCPPPLPCSPHQSELKQDLCLALASGHTSLVE